MVFTNTPATPPITTTTTTPDSDNDTPPRSHPISQFPFTNGTADKSHHHHHLPHHRNQQTPPLYASVVTYRECLKNHAVNLGGHALDGCGEFMPSASATPNDPASLTCAACGCHRNFHRQEPDEYMSHHFVPTTTPHFIDFRKPGRRPSLSPSPPPPPLPPIRSYPPAPQVLLSLSTDAHVDQQVPNHHQFTVVATPLTPRNAKSAKHNLSGRKRFRTKFTPQQKERMHSFAESLGWKMQRCNQTLVEKFCKEIGVGRGVLKVWMHNNKNTFGSKKESSITSSNPNRKAAATNNDDEHFNAGNNGELSPHGSTGYNMNCSLNDDGDEDINNESMDQNMANGIGSSPSS